MSDELKPCPFCGCKKVIVGADVSSIEHVESRWKAEGICWRCLSTGPTGFGPTEEEAKAEAAASWNARASVTDEQFTTAVHDGRAWQVVRTCEMLEVQTGEKTDYWDAEEIIWHCQSCHEERAVYAFGEDGGVWAEKPKFCPNCGAKVAPC